MNPLAILMFFDCRALTMFCAWLCTALRRAYNRRTDPCLGPQLEAFLFPPLSAQCGKKSLEPEGNA